MRHLLCYFNTGHVALPSNTIRDSLLEWVSLVSRFGSDSPWILDFIGSGDFSKLRKNGARAECLSSKWDGVDALFERLADLIGCDAGNLLLQPTFLSTLLLILRSLGRGREQPTVVYTDLDHPNVVAGIKAFAAELGMRTAMILIESRVVSGATSEEIEDRICRFVGSHRESILFLPHVDYRYGYTLNIASIARRLDPIQPLVVDAAHSLGVFKFDVTDERLVIVLGSGHKWLGGWRASAFAGVLGDTRLTSPIVTYWADQTYSAFSMLRHKPPRLGRGFVWGSVGEIPLLSLGIGLREFNRVGLSHITGKIRKLTEYLSVNVRSESWSLVSNHFSPSGIRYFFANDPSDFDAQATARQFREKHDIALSAYDQSRKGIRICITHNNGIPDIDKFNAVLSSYVPLKRSSHRARQVHSSREFHI